MFPDLSRYLQLFVGEASEHAEALSVCTAELMDHPRTEVLQEAYRHLHSIKGMAASLGFEEIVELSHWAEQTLGDPSAPPMKLSDSKGQWLLDAADRMLEMIRNRGQGSPAELRELLEPLPSIPKEGSELLPQASQTNAPGLPTTVGKNPTQATNVLRERLRGARVRTELLDDLVETAGDLLVGITQMRELVREASSRSPREFEDGVERLERRVRHLHAQVAQARLVPLSLLTDQLPHHLRESARETGREVELKVIGSEIEIDRALVEELADVLVHLLRNCVAHGIESPPERLAAGKPARGQLRVEAQQQRDQLILELQDDGRGFDLTRLKAAAVAAGRLSASLARDLSEADTLRLACLPGVSTAKQVTQISGRGIGLDVVQSILEGLSGSLTLSNDPGHGARFRMQLPLAMALTPVLLAEVAQNVVALPLSKILAARELGESERHRPLIYEGGELPLYMLASLLGLEEGLPTERPKSPPLAVILELPQGRAALQIDRLLGQQEVVLKPLSPPMSRVVGLAGVTVLGSGQPVFILDLQRLLAA